MKIKIEHLNINPKQELSEFLKEIGYINESEEMQDLTLNDLKNIIHIITDGEYEIEF